ncbi:hypothetical protein MKW92_016404 [Papaver armeniacum]|nr:hypothetical protein MKW92_016404 [Papaver armeniacum]
MLAKKVKQFSVLVLLIVVSAVTMGSAESQPLAPTQMDTIQIPGLFPPLLPGPYNPDTEKYLEFLFTFQIRLGPACCKAITDLSETCLPAVFAWGWGWGRGIPFNPTYPDIVRGYCASITAGATPPPAPFVVQTSPPPPPQVHVEAPKSASVEPPTTSVAIATAESQSLAPTQQDKIQIPGLFPPLLPSPYNPDIGKCWSTLADIDGCKAEILNFLYTFQLRLGPACCKAIIDLNETCLPAVFSSVWGWGRGIPFNPAYPNVVKGYCDSITAGKTSPPALNNAPSTEVHHN